MNINTLIFLSQQQIDLITSDYLFGREEKILFASKVRKLHLNGGEDSRILVITIGAIYLFKTRISKNAPITEYNLVDLEKVSYIKPNIVTFVSQTNDGKIQPLTVKSEYALDIGKMILYLNKICKYKLENIDEVKVESTPPDELVMPDIPNRPPYSLTIRIIQMLHKYGNRFPLEQLQLIAEWDRSPVPTLKITSAFNTGLASKAVAIALTWDVAITNISLDNYAPSHIQTILQILFSTSNTLARISLDNYKEPPSSVFDLPSSEATKLIELAFRNCHTSMIFAILNGMKSFQGRFHILTITRCKLNSEQFKILFETLNAMPGFLALNNLRLEEGTADGINIEDLDDFLSESRLKIISISRTTIDISILVSNITKYSNSVRSINLMNCRLCDMINCEVEIPPSLVYIDLTKAQVIPNALEHFMKTLTSKERTRLLTLNISDIATSSSIEEIVKCFDIPQAKPIFAEFIFSGNEMLSNDLKILTKFLNTQKKLQYLNLSRCFKDKVEDSFEVLADYVVHSNLGGLDISCAQGYSYGNKIVKFIEALIGKSPIHLLALEKTGMGDAGLEALKKLVDSNSKLTSLNCDGAQPQTLDVFLSAYETFCKLDRVMIPKLDLAQFGENVELPKEVTIKLPPKTLPARVAEYEAFDSSSTSVLYPMDAMINIMNVMANSIVRHAETNVFENGIIQAFKDSIVTTSISLKPHEKDESEKLFKIMDPSFDIHNEV